MGRAEHFQHSKKRFHVLGTYLDKKGNLFAHRYIYFSMRRSHWIVGLLLIQATSQRGAQFNQNSIHPIHQFILLIHMQ